jgi:hypothetical protein
MTTRISVDEWLSALGRARVGAESTEREAGVFRAEELRVLWNTGRIKTYDLLRGFVGDGLLESTRCFIKALDGRSIPVNAYRVTAEGDKAIKLLSKKPDERKRAERSTE